MGGDAPNMLRWLSEMDKHARNNENPPYVSDYYKGECCLECGAKIGFQFSCSWDMEHGLGVMTRKGKVINIGEADVAFGY